MRLIDADALQERLKKKKPDPAAPRYVEGFNDALLRFKSMVHSAPTIKAEQKKGKWITETINSYTKQTYCSVCNNKAPVAFVSDDYYANRAHGEINFTNYCPVCGADMRGEQE